MRGLIFKLNRKVSREEKRPVYLNIAGKNWSRNKEVRWIKSRVNRKFSARINREFINADLAYLRTL